MSETTITTRAPEYLYLLHTHTTLFLDTIATVRWRAGEAVVALRDGGVVLVQGDDVAALRKALGLAREEEG